jgi:carboxylesterase
MGVGDAGRCRHRRKRIASSWGGCESGGRRPSGFRPRFFCYRPSGSRVSVLLWPAIIAGGVLAVIVWGAAVLQRRRFDRLVGSRFPIGPLGIIRGAEPLVLRAEGAAVGVVLLHGFGDTPQTVAALARALRDRGYDVDVPLLPGHGRTLEQFAKSKGSEWLMEARRAHASMRARHMRVAVVGLSLGGALAASIAADDPELAALVLLAPYLDTPPWLRVLSHAAPAIGVVVPYVGGAGTQSIHDPAARAEALAYGATTPQLVRELVRVADAARAALPRVTAPTLYVQSREDNRITPAVASRAFASIGATTKRLEMLSGCGHVLTVDYCREQVASLVVEWLAEHAHGNETGTA